MRVKLTTCVLSLLLLNACSEPELTVRQVCDEKPEMCSDLNKDGHCNVERREVIVNRYIERKMPSDKNKYRLLADFEKYSKCINLASKIEHKKLKEKTTSRVEGYITSLKEIKRLSDDTRTSEMPELVYYHWSRNGDERSLKKFLALGESNKLETPELQFALATYWVKRDIDKTIGILYHTLELYKPDEEVNPEIFRTLTTVYLNKDDIKKAYVWAMVAKELGDKRVEIEEMKFMLMDQGASISKLDKLVDKTVDQIESYSFVSPLAKS